jgi:putative membrane protein
MSYKKAIMKRKIFSSALCLLAFMVWSCNDTNNDGSNVSDNPKDDSSGNNTSGTPTMSSATLTKEDSMFVMDAALGGLMEVESGNQAQQNASNPRVKNFGSMMVNDHGKANEELKNLVSGKGMTLPSALPEDLQKKMDEMKKMKGKTFDSHYMSMMDDDHKKTIDKFEKQANSGGDAQLKSWASSALPVLKKHLDSVQAIRKGM